MFKAVELDSASRRRTGRELELAADTRQAAIERLLEQLGVATDQARVDPTRTLVQIGANVWTLVVMQRAEVPESSRQRRAGAKHKRVR